MFNLDEFENTIILEKVDKLNRFLNKNKLSKASKIIHELELLLDHEEHSVPITYLFSVLAEENFNLIPNNLFQKIFEFLNSDNIKLKTNSIIIIGFALISNPKFVNNFFSVFTEFIKDKSEDIRNNVIYFLQELLRLKPELLEQIVDLLIESLLLENKSENISSLLDFLELCSELSYDQLYNLRDTLKTLIPAYEKDKASENYEKIISLIQKFFPNLKEKDLKIYNNEELIVLLDNQFLMKKYNFTEISKIEELRLKDFLEKFKKSPLKDKKIYFYIRSKGKKVLVYELERSKLFDLFEKERKILKEEILKTFSLLIKEDSELRLFLRTMIKLNIISGFFSNLGYFYPSKFIRSKLLNDLNSIGEINLKKYDYLPLDFTKALIEDIAKSPTQYLLLGKEKNAYYSLKKIQEQINIQAAKESVIDLRTYREKLTDEDFIKLIKNLPREYLSKYRKGTQWLTNLGTLQINKAVENSKIIGYFSISKISNDLNLSQILLLDVFDQYVDKRSGIWDRKKEIFYYSRYLKEKIDEISKLSNEIEKLEKINKMSIELNIDKNLISTKIDENLQLIAEEIKQQEKINISDYMEKTGMDLDNFLKFIEDLNINYFKKADQLIFNPLKIEEVQNEIKYMLINHSKSKDYISLGTFDITSNLIKQLINSLMLDGKLRGIFYEHENEIFFYTEKGIMNLMLENSFIFSFHDLFYGKELTLKEIELLKEIFEDLVSNKRLNGTFDEKTFTFSSNEVLFAKDYNTALFEFEQRVNKYLEIFVMEFQKIKRILTKKNETIFPQEIKSIQELIDKINEKYIGWRNSLEAFISRVNKKMLKDQGLSLKKYKTLNLDQSKSEIKVFEEDPEVYDLLKKFNDWVNIFNKIELKYPNIIFYQKRLVNNSEDKESKEKLRELTEELCLS